MIGGVCADFNKISVEALEMKYLPSEIARLLLRKYDCMKRSISFLLLQMFSFLAAFTIVGMYHVMNGSAEAVSGIEIYNICRVTIC